MDEAAAVPFVRGGRERDGSGPMDGGGGALYGGCGGYIATGC